MTGIHYKTDLAGVDWEEMKAVLVADDFCNGRSPHQYKLSFENSSITIVAYAKDKIIGTVRVLSDGVCNAYIVDVWTHTPYRKQGVATKMMEMALSQLDGHHACLFTDDATEFYKKLHFRKDATGMERLVGRWLQNDSLIG